MEQFKSGNVIELKVIGQDGSRWVLDGQEEEIYLNMSEADEDVTVGQEVRVFLYANRRGKLTATMQMPKMSFGTYGWARVIRVDDEEGVYVDIGSSFEVLVNKADMPRIRSLWPKTDDELYMTLRTDLGGTIFGRLATEERVLEEIVPAPASVMNDNLTARAYRLLPVGSFMLTEPENYRVFVHQSEQEAEPRLGQSVSIRVIDVHNDGTLNGSMLPRKEERLGGDAEMIWQYLNDIGGRMPFTDRSTPEEVKEMFNLSKGAFKRALGKLMKEGKVTQSNGWTEIK